MKTSKAHYIQLRPHADLPDLKHLEQFMAIAVIDDDSDEMWRWDVARWLVASGCRFLLAWGKECESWREAIDDAADESFDGDEAAPEQAVMGTSHEDEDLEEVFWFARHRASHPALQFTDTVILHVAAIGRGEELLEQFADA